MGGNNTSIEPVSLNGYIKSCETIEEALGITPERMRSLEQTTKTITQGATKVAEALHAIATYDGFSDYDRTYVAFKFTESISHTLKSTVIDICLEEGDIHE